MAKNIEDEMLSGEEFVDLVARAESLRQYDESKRRLLPVIEDNKRKMSVQESLEESDSMGIPKEYFLRALNMRVPSVEVQLEELEEHNAMPMIGTIIEMYRKSIMGKLEETFPSRKFECKREYNEVHGFTKLNIFEMKKRGLFKRKENWAMLCFEDDDSRYHEIPIGKFALSHRISDPLFTHVCGETVKEITDYFEKKGNLAFYDVKQDYLENPLEVEGLRE